MKQIGESSITTDYMPMYFKDGRARAYFDKGKPIRFDDFSKAEKFINNMPQEEKAIAKEVKNIIIYM